jgi:hypothetical protein
LPYAGPFLIGGNVLYEKGGTDKWCPNCEKIRVVKAVNSTELGFPSGQHWLNREHTDIHWFRRGQICQTCGQKWLSAELPESFVSELVRLRSFVSELVRLRNKQTRLTAIISEYVEAAEQSEKKLADLQTALGNLHEEEKARLIEFKGQIL